MYSRNLYNKNSRTVFSHAVLSLVAMFLLASCSADAPKPSKVHVKAARVKGNDGAEYSLSRVLITPENLVRISVIDKATTKTEVGAVSKARYEATTPDLFAKSCKEIKLSPTKEGVTEADLARFTITQNIPSWVFVRRCV